MEHGVKTVRTQDGDRILLPKVRRKKKSERGYSGKPSNEGRKNLAEFC